MKSIVVEKIFFCGATVFFWILDKTSRAVNRSCINTMEELPLMYDASIGRS